MDGSCRAGRALALLGLAALTALAGGCVVATVVETAVDVTATVVTTTVDVAATVVTAPVRAVDAVLGDDGTPELPPAPPSPPAPAAD